MTRRLLDAAIASAVVLCVGFVLWFLIGPPPVKLMQPTAHLWELLPGILPTLALLAGSIVIALLAGSLLHLPASRNRGASVAVAWIAVALRSLPFFWVAFVLAIVFAPRIDLEPAFFQWLVPSCVLSLVQIPIVVRALDASKRVTSLVAAFAARLPEIVAAEFLTEIAFEWPGLGKAFYYAATSAQRTLAVGILVVVALFTIAVRLTATMVSDA
ncbi:MAG: hypothetical protein JO199_07825 [Candidatus Eremiobacteraeota bacterium]|nr:hypothetical protein [Candidatus Eremiobacteraeota bacterium]